MARMHSGRKGKSGSKKPLSKEKPAWVRHTEKEVEALILKLAKAGNKPSQIGLILRDTYGIPDVKIITKKSVTKVLEENKMLGELPDDIMFLIKKQIRLMKHLELNKHDQPSKRGLILIDSKIRRLTKYYKKKGKIATDWKYDMKKAKILSS
ncbi:30S ribosomal protein S15 [Candidatus Woesearchaeota archaeon]|nr:30S ribosomal protein S15 [Candidatus Woesearchaeota archaeon]